MDVAGALGWTSIFPFVLSIVFFVWSALYVDDHVKNPHTTRVFYRILAPGVVFALAAIVGWITAIWMGYAQGAA